MNFKMLKKSALRFLEEEVLLKELSFSLSVEDEGDEEGRIQGRTKNFKILAIKKLHHLQKI